MNLLFVCTANVSRSYLAEKLMQNQIRLLGLDPVAVRSAGVLDLKGSSADEAMRTYLLTQGIAESGHQARPVAGDDIAWADVIFVMEQSHADELTRRWPPSRPKILPLSRFLPPDQEADEILDPYGGTEFQYRLAQSKIRLAVETLAAVLLEARQEDRLNAGDLLQRFRKTKTP